MSDLSVLSFARRSQPTAVTRAESMPLIAEAGTPKLVGCITPSDSEETLRDFTTEAPEIISAPNLTASREITPPPFNLQDPFASARSSVKTSFLPNRQTIPSTPVEMFVEEPQEILGNGDLFRLFQKFKEVNPAIEPNCFFKKFKSWLKQFQRVNQDIYKKVILKLNAFEKKIEPAIQIAIFTSSSYEEVFQKIGDISLQMPSTYRNRIKELESDRKHALEIRNFGDESLFAFYKRELETEWQDRMVLIKHLYKIKAFVFLFAQTESLAEKTYLLRQFFDLNPFILKNEYRTDNIELLKKIRNYYTEALGLMRLQNFFGVNTSTFPAWFTQNPGVRGENISTPFLETIASRANLKTNLTPFHFYLMFNLINFNDDEFTAAKKTFSEEIIRLWPGLNLEQIIVTRGDIEIVANAIRLNLIPALQRMGGYSDLQFFCSINGGELGNYHRDFYTHQEDPILRERGLAADEYSSQESDLTVVFRKNLESLKKEFLAVRRRQSSLRYFTDCWSGAFEWDNLQCMQGRLIQSMPSLEDIAALVSEQGVNLKDLLIRYQALPTLAQIWSQ